MQCDDERGAVAEKREKNELKVFHEGKVAAKIEGATELGMMIVNDGGGWSSIYVFIKKWLGRSATWNLHRALVLSVRAESGNKRWKMYPVENLNN